METRIMKPAKTPMEKFIRTLERPFWYFPGGKPEGRAFRRPMDAFGPAAFFGAIAASPLLVGPHFVESLVSAGAGDAAGVYMMLVPLPMLAFGAISAACIKSGLGWPNNLYGRNDRFFIDMYVTMDKAGFTEDQQRDFLRRWNTAGRTADYDGMKAMSREYADLRAKVAAMPKTQAPAGP
jgi:hypothetical protein